MVGQVSGVRCLGLGVHAWRGVFCHVAKDLNLVPFSDQISLYVQLG